jgi:DnaJ-class molecular chaperone
MGEERAEVLPGNLIFVIHELQHNTFRREKNDLHTNLSISLKEALLGNQLTLFIGFSKQIPHLDGHSILIKRDEVTQPGQV